MSLLQLQEETELHLEGVIQTEEETLLYQEDHQTHQETKKFALPEEQDQLETQEVLMEIRV